MLNEMLIWHRLSIICRRISKMKIYPNVLIINLLKYTFLNNHMNKKWTWIYTAFTLLKYQEPKNLLFSKSFHFKHKTIFMSPIINTLGHMRHLLLSYWLFFACQKTLPMGKSIVNWHECSSDNTICSGICAAGKKV